MPLDKGYLRERAREAIIGGKLPAGAAYRSWIGRGVGASCAICEQTIPREEIEYEVQFPEDGVSAPTLHLHVQCFQIWQLERRKAP